LTGSRVSLRASTAGALQGARARLLLLRVLGYAASLAEAAVIVGCFVSVWRTPSRWAPFLVAFTSILVFLHLVPILVSRLITRKKQRVHREGDSWTVGKYSEAQVREAARQCTRTLPAKLREPRIVIGDCRGTTGWTWLSLLWPGRQRHKTVWISAGALHYLEPEELQALIVHEIAHHDAGNRGDVPGGWAMADMTLFCLIFLLGSGVGLGARARMWTFLLLRLAMASVVAKLRGKSDQTIEHLCDLYAATHVGREAVVNMLLKVGEEAELTEAVLARAAQELRYVQGADVEELTYAFDDVRPYGRIFHDNLFRHASQVVAEAVGDLKEIKGSDVKEEPNISFMRFLTERRQARQKRIRWRRFDRDGDGRLTEGEIAELCTALREHPDRALFLCDRERNPTTHPSVRDRIVLVAESVT
jgi:Zn-dependent protease with chaperone function